MAIQRELEEIAYSFFRFIDTNEIHIIHGKFIPDNCTAKFESICKKIKDRRTDNVELIEKCLNEDEARQYAANTGRDICGICVSNLYTTYEE